MEYFIGIDGGGTRSRLAAIDKNGTVIGRHTGGSTNITSETFEGVAANIKNLIAEFNANTNTTLQNCAAICIGSAGASTGKNTKLLGQIFRNIGHKGALKIINDAELVLLAATKGQPGIIIISGTGSVGYATDKEGTTYRAGGWGHIIDDGGSGYRIGMDAIKSALLDYDGRGEKTILTKAVTEFFNQPTPDKVLGYIYGASFQKAEIAKVAMLVSNAANQGDNVSLAILQQAANDLIALAHALMKKVPAGKIVISGSVIVQNKIVRTSFEKTIAEKYPHTQVVTMTEDAELGAAHVAVRLQNMS